VEKSERDKDKRRKKSKKRMEMVEGIEKKKGRE